VWCLDSGVRGRCPLEVRVSFDPCRAASPGIQLPVLAWLAGSSEDLGGMILDGCDGYTVNVISLAGRAFSVGRVPLLLMPVPAPDFSVDLPGDRGRYAGQRGVYAVVARLAAQRWTIVAVKCIRVSYFPAGIGWPQISGCC
jgi:hypothetical protein